MVASNDAGGHAHRRLEVWRHIEGTFNNGPIRSFTSAAMIEYVLNSKLPSLAWLATVDASTGDLLVTHGCYVETNEACFFEGAWAGDFGAGLPGETEVAFGSGATTSPDGTLFVSSVATTDYLFYKQSAAGITIANSLALLLAALNDALDPAFRGYDAVHNSILKGVDDYERVIPTRDGSVARLMHHNLWVSNNRIEETAKPESPAFACYDDYQSYLSASYALLACNARDPRRRFPLKIYSTQSRGYDSSAVNAIAAPHGLDGVFTVTTGKGGGAFADQATEPEVSDDGTEIGRILGVTNILSVDRRAFTRDFADEAYFYASIHEPQDANLTQITKELAPPALLLTGTLGELWYTRKLWYNTRPAYLKPDLRRGDLGLHGITEFRIRSGFVQVAIPYVGARRRADIVDITESPEMAPWRLGTSYDRPIPRRLAESAGVPRSAFGQIKVGSVVQFTPPAIPQSAELRKSYFDFLVREHLRNRFQIMLFPLVHKINRWACFASETRYPVVYYAFRILSKLRRKEIRPSVIWGDLRASVHCFAVNRCVAEYRNLLAPALPD